MSDSNQNFVADTLIVTFLLAATVSTNAHAYVDPGSGGVIVTAILGFFAAIGYTFRKYFYKIKSSIFGKSDSVDEDDL